MKKRTFTAGKRVKTSLYTRKLETNILSKIRSMASISHVSAANVTFIVFFAQDDDLNVTNSSNKNILLVTPDISL
jgi:hypothetical protein